MVCAVARAVRSMMMDALDLLVVVVLAIAGALWVWAGLL